MAMHVVIIDPCKGLMFVHSHENIHDAQPQMCCKHCITLLIVRHHCPATFLTPSALNIIVSHLNENNASVLGGCLAGSILGMNGYRMTSTHWNAFQYSVLCMFSVRHLMLDLKEGLHLPCSCLHRDIVCLQAVDLEIAAKHC